MKDIILAPSILSADFSNLEKGIHYIEHNSGGWVHLDVMDGSFVPNITIGPPVVAALRPLTALPFDVHLMIERPENHIAVFADAGADYITFHYEAAVHHHRIIEQIHQSGKKAGISIVPSTPVSVLEEILPFIDVVLIMTVNPGFGGQKMIDSCVKKLDILSRIRQERGLSYILSVDGGVNSKTYESVVTAGADVVVSGSAFFSGELQWQ
jgi:ribulose-phosphate 3-epimerase